MGTKHQFISPHPCQNFCQSLFHGFYRLPGIKRESGLIVIHILVITHPRQFHGMLQSIEEKMEPCETPQAKSQGGWEAEPYHNLLIPTLHEGPDPLQNYASQCGKWVQKDAMIDGSESHWEGSGESIEAQSLCSFPSDTGHLPRVARSYLAASGGILGSFRDLLPEVMPSCNQHHTAKL